MAEIRVIGNGSVHPLDGKPRYRARKWQLRVKYEEDGAAKTATRTFPSAREKREGVQGTLKQAEAALAEFVREMEGTTDHEAPDSPTFGEYAEEWQRRRRESGDYAERTVKAQGYALRNVSALIGDVPLADINATVMEGVYARLRAGETLSGRPLAGTTLAQVHRAVVGMVHYAESHGDVSPGLLRGLRMPKKNDVDRRALGDEQAAAVLDAVAGDLHPWSVMASLCLACGLRRSEALALRWSDVEGGTASVTKSLDEHGGPKSTKSRAGVRNVPIPEKEARILASWKEEQGLSDDGAICSWDGSYCLPSAATVWWQRNAGSLGCEGVKLHELRHTYITMLARSGVHPRVAQYLAGHGSLAVTMEVYTHVEAEDAERAVSSVQAFS